MHRVCALPPSGWPPAGRDHYATSPHSIVRAILQVFRGDATVCGRSEFVVHWAHMARNVPSQKNKPAKKAKPPAPSPVIAVHEANSNRETSPQKPSQGAHGERHVSFLLFFVLVIAFATLLFGLVRLTSPSPVREELPVPEREGSLPEEVRAHKDFRTWIDAWRTVDPYVSRSEFRVAEERIIDVDRLSASGVNPEEGEIVPPRTNRYAWSPDRGRFADFLSAYGGPDHAFRVWNRDGSGRIEMLEYCGTPCRYDGAFWLDNDRLVLLSAIEALKADGMPYCPGADEGDAVCYQRLLVTVYDFGRGRSQTYRTEPHAFHTDPFEESHRKRWASGLTSEEKILTRYVVPDDLIAIDGNILSVIDGVMAVRSADGDFAVRTFPQTTYRDEFAGALAADNIRRGFTVRVSGIADGGTRLSATDIRILKAPNVIVYAPADGDVVASSFTVTGIARTFEQNVRIRVRNAAGNAILDTHVTADATEPGVHGDFSLVVKVPKGKVSPGQRLTLDVFESSADDGTEVNKVSIMLTYKP